MKILYTADWHIKLGQKNVPREWQKDRYYLMFNKIKELSKQVDLVIIGGDIFDSAPKLDEVALFMCYVQHNEHKHLIYSGNHEATKKTNSFLPLLEDIITNDNFIIQGDYISNEYGLDIIPHSQLHKLEKYKPTSNILCTHIRGEILPHVKAELNLELLDKWEVVLSGDLHAYSNSQRNILYPGSPLPISFHRNSTTNGVIIFNTDSLHHEWIDLKLPQLIRKKITKESEIINTEYDHTIYELEGSITELSNVTNNLLDKKLISKTVDSQLSLTKDMSIEEELTLYWKNAVNFNNADIKNLLQIFHNKSRAL